MSQHIEVDYGMALEFGISQGCYVLAEESVSLLQAENAALKEQVAEQAKEIATLIELLRLRGNIGNPAYEQQVTDTIKGII